MMTTYRTMLACGMLAAAVAVTGCQSTRVQNIPVDRERPLTTDFDPDDARRTVEAMIDSLLSTRIDFSEYATQGSRPVLDISRLENRTMQHIDTVSLTDSIRTKLLRSGQFRFKDRSTAGDDLSIMNEEVEGGLVNPDKAVMPGQQIATELYLYGAIVEMRTDAGRVRDAYYKITLNLKDLKSGELVWADEKELRKERTKPILGL